jgi:hypothetical protein
MIIKRIVRTTTAGVSTESILLSKTTNVKVQILILFQIFFGSAMIWWMTFPFFSSRTRLIGYILFCLGWFLATLAHDFKFLFTFLNHSKYWLLWGAILLLYFFLNYGGEMETQLLSFIMILPIISIFSFCEYKRAYRLEKILFNVLIIGLIITSIITIRFLIQDPLASRVIAIAEGNSFYSMKGVGGFSFVYSLVLLCPVLFYSFIYTKSGNRWLYLLISCLFGITVIAASYAIANIVMFMLLVVPIVFNKKNILPVTIVFIIVLLAGKFLLSFAYDYILSIENTIIRIRFLELYNFALFNEVQASSDISLRLSTYTGSFIKFISNPIFGVGAFFGTSGEVVGIGGHSEWLDLLARFGIVGSLPLLLFISSILKNIKSSLQKKTRPIYIIILFYFLLLGLVNPFLGLVSMTTIFLLPFLFNTQRKHENNLKFV